MSKRNRDTSALATKSQLTKISIRLKSSSFAWYPSSNTYPSDSLTNWIWKSWNLSSHALWTPLQLWANPSKSMMARKQKVRQPITLKILSAALNPAVSAVGMMILTSLLLIAASKKWQWNVNPPHPREEAAWNEKEANFARASKKLERWNFIFQCTTCQCENDHVYPSSLLSRSDISFQLSNLLETKRKLFGTKLLNTSKSRNGAISLPTRSCEAKTTMAKRYAAEASSLFWIQWKEEAPSLKDGWLSFVSKDFNDKKGNLMMRKWA